MPWNLPPDKSCALDMAERGEHTLKEIGDALGLTRERIRQVLLEVSDHVLRSKSNLAAREALQETIPEPAPDLEPIPAVSAELIDMDMGADVGWVDDS
jgi:hypothetical protein